jgi:hypothetical protein
MNNVFRNLGASVGAPIAGSLLATYTLTSGPFAGHGLPSHLAFQLVFWIAAAVTLAGGLAVVFAEEVLGPFRHSRFAHYPASYTRRGARGAAASPPAPPLPEPNAAPSAGPVGRMG